MMKCDPKAMARCPGKTICGGDATFAEGSECDKFNQTILDQPPTNADRIRAMSDEELADAIRCPLAIRGVDAFPNCCEYDTCRQCALNWLQQPAEDDAT